MRVWMGRAACVPALARMPAGALCTCPISRPSCSASTMRHPPRPTLVLRVPCVCEICLGPCSERCGGCPGCVRARSSRGRASWQASCCALFSQTDFGRPAGCVTPAHTRHRLWPEKGRRGKGSQLENAHAGVWEKRGEGRHGRVRDERRRRKTRGEIAIEMRELR